METYRVINSYLATGIYLLLNRVIYLWYNCDVDRCLYVQMSHSTIHGLYHQTDIAYLWHNPNL